MPSKRRGRSVKLKYLTILNCLIYIYLLVQQRRSAIMGSGATGQDSSALDMAEMTYFNKEIERMKVAVVLSAVHEGEKWTQEQGQVN